MKKIILILFLCCYSAGFSQKIQYIPVFIDPCTGQIDTNVIFDIKERFDKHKSKGIKIELDQKGKYILQAMRNFDFYNIREYDINIEQTGIVRDTFYLMKIKTVEISQMTIYYYCGKKAEGYLEDYYYQGGLRCCGTFENGYPVDTVKEFYRSGIIKEISIPWADDSLHYSNYGRILNYDENGVLVSYYNRGIYYNKEYYPNGNLKHFYYMDDRSNYALYNYYENGDLKSVSKDNQTAYYDSTGLPVQKVVRKNIKSSTGHKKSIAKEVNIEWTLYNKTGERAVDIIFRQTLLNSLIFNRAIKDIQPEEFREVILYKDNQAINRIEFEYYYENGELLWNYVLSRQTNNNWEVVKRDKIDNVYDIILGHMMQAGIKIEYGR